MGNQPTKLHQLHDAIRKNNIKALKIFIKNERGDINKMVNAQTALFIAILEESEEMTDVLLEAGAQTNTICLVRGQDNHNEYEWSCIHETCRIGAASLLEKLIDHGCNINLPAHHAMTPLHIASWHGCENIVRILVKAGCDVNQLDGFRESSLVVPICQGDLSMVQLLLSAGCRLNARSWGDFRKTLGCNTAPRFGYGRKGPYSLLFLTIKFAWLHIACVLLQHGFNSNNYRIHDLLLNIRSNLGVIGQDARWLMRSFLAAGYRFQWNDELLLRHLIEEENHGYDEELVHELIEKSRQPYSLQELCRVVIRVRVRVGCGQRSILGRLRSLHIPRSLISYLSMSEFDVWVDKETRDSMFVDNQRDKLYLSTAKQQMTFIGLRVNTRRKGYNVGLRPLQVSKDRQNYYRAFVKVP